MWAWALLAWEVSRTKSYADIGTHRPGKMVSGLTPFYNAGSQGAMLLRIVQCQMPDLEREAFFSARPGLVAVLRRCWLEDPSSRATIQDCLEALIALGPA